jgi:hypothetical protein
MGLKIGLIRNEEGIISAMENEHVQMQAIKW